MDSSHSYSPDSVSRSGTSNGLLWGVIGALVVAVAALGGVLIYQRNGATPTLATSAATGAAPAMPGQRPLSAPDDGTPPPAVAANSNAPQAGNSAAPAGAPGAPAYAPQQPGVATNAPMVAAAPPAAPPRPVCTVCGRVESVQTVKRAAPPTGVGAVAGGVVGGVIGNQFGHGGGRTAATLLGAAGGGYAGHTIEKRTRTETRYQVRVRMADGSLRTVETKTAPPIGKAVTLKGQVLRPADGRA